MHSGFDCTLPTGYGGVEQKMKQKQSLVSWIAEVVNEI